MSAGGLVVILACLMVVFSDLAAAQTTRAVPGGTFRTVTISTEPNASIWLDGVLYGKADAGGKLTIKTVPAGTHTIRVRADGFKEISKPLPAAQRGDLLIPLAKTTDAAELAYQEAVRLTSVDRQKAAEAFKKALRLRPNYVEAGIGLARVYSEAGDHEQALKAVRDTRRMRPGVAELSAVEGRIYRDTGEESQAIAAFKRAIAEGKGFQPEAYTGLGLLYKDRAEAAGSDGDYRLEEANYNEAAKYLSTAIKQMAGAPDAIVVYELLGLIYEKQKKFKEAIALYEEFLLTFPESPEATAVRSYITQIKKQMADQR